MAFNALEASNSNMFTEILYAWWRAGEKENCRDDILTKSLLYLVKEMGNISKVVHKQDHQLDEMATKLVCDAKL